jgi:hypothetical protein
MLYKVGNKTFFVPERRWQKAQLILSLRPEGSKWDLD